MSSRLSRRISFFYVLAAGLSLFAGFAAPLSGHAAPAADPACRSNAANAPLAPALVAAALHEYRSFNGHRIDADGRLWKFGSVEAETELLHDPDSGAESQTQPDRFAWRRVWHYWQALGETRRNVPLSRRITWVPGLLDDPATEARARSLTLGELLDRLKDMDPDQAAPLREAAVRAALVDSPWSGAFISYVMKQGGMTAQQFQFSGAHADYIRKAFEQPEGYAYRACDPRTTEPKVGDLVCYSRGKDPFADFAAWQANVDKLGGGVKSHCDLVIAVDRPARKIEAVGGNVLQSVTRRRLKLNEAGFLSDSHMAGRDRIKPGSACADDVTCRHSDLNKQYWGVLLQLKP